MITFHSDDDDEAEDLCVSEVIGGWFGFCGMYLRVGFSAGVSSNSAFDNPKMFDKFDLELLLRER